MDVLWFLVLILSVSTFVISSPDEHWHRYKEQHGKKYDNKTEIIRRKTFELSKERVINHNRQVEEGVHSYNLSLNHLADRPQHKHLTKTLTGLLKSRHTKYELLASLEPGEEIPEEFDWRKQGFHTPGWNQEDCGSCYAFTVASAIEGQDRLDYVLQSGFAENIRIKKSRKPKMANIE